MEKKFTYNEIANCNAIHFTFPKEFNFGEYRFIKLFKDGTVFHSLPLLRDVYQTDTNSIMLFYDFQNNNFQELKIELENIPDSLQNEIKINTIIREHHPAHRRALSI
ncbi:MAG TPA: hypothetical protein VI757_03880 [Bacteroidia bacterium]|nr:hypothetical protein [Bacteroidia bacterium]